jgi:hypothetical protein
MSIRYHADRELGCTVAVWDGDVTGEDARKHLVRLAGDPNWPPGPLHLADLRTTAAVSIPDPELVELLFEGSTLAGGIRIAVVVRPDFLAGTDERFDATMGEMNAATFVDLGAACRYLDVDATRISAIVDELKIGPSAAR